MRIAIVNITDPKKDGALNKDLAGGLGTYSRFGESIFSKILGYVKKKLIKLPLFLLANVQAILKEKGFKVQYFEDTLPAEFFDIIIVYTSMVDYKYEIAKALEYKKLYNNAKVGFIGDVVSIIPDLYKEADFIISGEADAFFLYQFDNINQLHGNIEVTKKLNLNDLPSPDYTDFPITKYGYFPALKEKPVVTLQASRGCPYSCGYYCPYGANQGANYRLRDADKIVEDIKHLVVAYKVKAIIFRDPLFGLNFEQVEKICNGIIQANIKVVWAIETRLDLLDEDKINLMYKAGLRDISIGVETVDKSVAKNSKRKLVEHEKQLNMIKMLQSKGISVNAFYMLGLNDDTVESCKATIEYAKELETNTAQFTIATPYPGTEYYKQIKGENKLTTSDYEKYDAYSLVFKHKNLSDKELQSLKEFAFRSYYLRVNYIWNFILWRIKELF